MSIPKDIITNLRDDLLRCEQFNNRETLVTLFVDDRISPWRYHVPNAPTPVALVDALIEMLHDLYNAEEENALVLFLQVLGERMPQEDTRGPKLAKLAHRLAKMLATKPGVAPPALNKISKDGFGASDHHFAHVLLGEFVQNSNIQEETMQVERIVDYAVRLSQERQGQGADLTKAEWTLLVTAIWLRICEGKQTGTVASPYNIEAKKIAHLQAQEVVRVPAETILAGQQLRLRLLSALLILANALDIDDRVASEGLPTAASGLEVKFDWLLHRYVQGVLIRAGKIGLVFCVPDHRYPPLLQIWIAGKVQRVFNQIVSALIDEEWYLWLVSSTSELNPDIPSLPDDVRQQLGNEQTLRKALEPLVATLSALDGSVLRPTLIPAPLTSLRQPPSRLGWQIPLQPKKATFKVLLVEEQSGQEYRFERLDSPELSELEGIDWKPGRTYRWSIFQQVGKHSYRLESSYFHLLTENSRDALAQAEAQVPPGAAYRMLWHKHGLYEAIISSLLEIVITGTTIVERLAARRELAECYEHIAGEARQKNLLSIADEYQSLATSQYGMLRRCLKEQL